MKPLFFFAYLDPGSGSLIIQMIIGSVVAGLFAIKAYWKKALTFFNFRRDKTPPEHKV